MNKRIMKKLLAGLLVCLCLLTSLPVRPETAYALADSYTDAEVFFESTGKENGQHIDCYDGMVYFATKAKAATSSTALKYTSVGFDVTLEGAGKKLTFAVKRGGSLREIKQPEDNGTYNYRLYYISTEDLHTLASKVNKTAADAIFASDKFDVRMDAIMTTKQNGVDHGAIKENGDGTITVVSNPIYHLNKTSDLNALKSKFNNDFKSFIGIETSLENITQHVYYQVTQDVITNGAYKSQTGTIRNTSVPNLLHENGELVHKEYKTLQRFTLLDASGTGPKIKKTGYHLGDGLGGSVWKKSSGETFSITRDYGPKDLNQQAGTKSTYIILSPNWQPNKYTIHYDANGGTSVVNDTIMEYDKTGYLKNNTFKKEGYYIDETKAWIDANGKTYANGQAVINMTTIHNDTVTLKANWQPIVAQITLDKQGGSGGTDAYFQKYATGFYTTNACTTLLNMVSKPNRTGYDFMGYFTSFNGLGGQITSSTGAFQQPNTYFKGNATIYANWKAKTFPVTFDKQGGRYGSDSATATFGELYPVADAPERPGFRFMGYYTGTNGTGTQIYNEFMNSTEKYMLTTGTTLYAYWVDDIPPVINLTVSNNKWTNKQVTLTAEASDFGSGLESVHIYRVNADGTETPMASATNLNGAATKNLSFTNTTEGIVRYKAVATDRDGNVAESINVVYYDTKAPTGTIVDKLVNGNNFYFDIDITDINTGN